MSYPQASQLLQELQQNDKKLSSTKYRDMNREYKNN